MYDPYIYLDSLTPTEIKELADTLPDSRLKRILELRSKKPKSNTKQLRLEEAR